MSEIKKIVKDRKGNPKGILLAVDMGDHVNIGFSSCKTKYDKFDKDFGTRLARTRAFKGSSKTSYSIVEEMPKFRDRCRRYFKGKYVAIPLEIKNGYHNLKKDPVNIVNV